MAGPLEGIRVIELTSMLSGPYAAELLGDMGADVIKVEPPEGDAMRPIGPLLNEGMSPVFMNANRNKRSVALDLKLPSGREAMLKLLASADVFVTNVRSKPLAKLGLSYEDIKTVRGDIVYLSITGYGEGGPYDGQPAYDDLIQAATGLPTLSKVFPDAEPAYIPIAIADRTASLHATNAVCAALFHRAKTGKGQKIQIPMFETLASMVFADHLAGQTYEPPIGPTGFIRYVSKRRPLPTKDGYIGVMIHTDRQWAAFAAQSGDSSLPTDERFANVASRSRHLQELYAVLSKALVTKTGDEWLRLLRECDIPASKLQTTESLLDDPHLNAVGFFKMSEHPTEGRIREVNIPSKWSLTQPTLRLHCPRVGENSKELLEELGYTQEQLAQAVTDGGVRIYE
ncbi:CoA transferase [Caballeronia sp. LP006]|uniref:CaiB/BaiF CoA transferase family protein n=1 Tax=Caballeronia sp. LP006 TaxID=3038552 RepID=UPI00285F430C|nr:CoA transferase [Caballeronia sp. LP006]MDR5826276.1 CoA transferase [Caballeronia sp. LP006]